MTHADNTHTQRLSKAKTRLVLDHPFVGTVALNMPFELCDMVETASTDGKQVLFNRDFIGGLSDDELLFLVAHECMHPMLEHNFRRGERDPATWNIAADYVINELLVQEKIGVMPEQGVQDTAIYNQGGGVAEKIYANIYQDKRGGGGGNKKTPGSGPGKGALDDCLDGGGTPAEQAQQQAEWRVKVAQAAQAAKMQGKLSAGLQRLVDEVLSPKVDWRTVLQNFLVRSRDDARSYARFNRRFLSQGIYLPSVAGETVGELVFAIDCSGSIGQDELDQFAAELQRVKDDLNPTVMYVMYFDSSVAHVEHYTAEDDLNIRPHGGGGTAFAPVFTKIDELGIDPNAVVFLTDLYCSDFGSIPDYPVLWVATCEGGSNPPFGDTVYM